MPNDGCRITIDRRDGKYYLTLTLNGDQHTDNRGYMSPGECATAGDDYRRQIELGRFFKKQERSADDARRVTCRTIKAMLVWVLLPTPHTE